jgi:hypothetical protein
MTMHNFLCGSFLCDCCLNAVCVQCGTVVQGKQHEGEVVHVLCVHETLHLALSFASREAVQQKKMERWCLPTACRDSRYASGESSMKRVLYPPPLLSDIPIFTFPMLFRNASFFLDSFNGISGCRCRCSGVRLRLGGAPMARWQQSLVEYFFNNISRRKQSSNEKDKVLSRIHEPAFSNALHRRYYHTINAISQAQFQHFCEFPRLDSTPEQTLFGQCSSLHQAEPSLSRIVKGWPVARETRWMILDHLCFDCRCIKQY